MQAGLCCGASASCNTCWRSTSKNLGCCASPRRSCLLSQDRPLGSSFLPFLACWQSCESAAGAFQQVSLVVVLLQLHLCQLNLIFVELCIEHGLSSAGRCACTPAGRRSAQTRLTCLPAGPLLQVSQGCAISRQRHGQRPASVTASSMNGSASLPEIDGKIDLKYQEETHVTQTTGLVRMLCRCSA